MTGQCPQEELQLVAAQLPHSVLPAEVLPIFPAKADKSRSAFFDPHFGQVTATFSSRFRKRTSYISPHFEHLNSNIGIVIISSTDPVTRHFTIAQNERPSTIFCSRNVMETFENVKRDRLQTDP